MVCNLSLIHILRTHYDNIKQMVKEKTGRAMQEKERERKGKNGKIVKICLLYTSCQKRKKGKGKRRSVGLLFGRGGDVPF